MQCTYMHVLYTEQLIIDLKRRENMFLSWYCKVIDLMLNYKQNYFIYKGISIFAG